MITHDRRLAQLEAKRNAGSVELGVLFIPRGLSEAERAAWLAARPAGGSGPGVIIIPHKGERMDPI
jgi:hypothetical protein